MTQKLENGNKNFLQKSVLLSPSPELDTASCSPSQRAGRSNFLTLTENYYVHAGRTPNVLNNECRQVLYFCNVHFISGYDSDQNVKDDEGKEDNDETPSGKDKSYDEVDKESGELNV